MLIIDELKTSLIGPINLVLEDGSCTAISGPSGAGKSLFLRALADLDESSGTITLNGRDRERFSAPDWRRKVAYVPAESGWWSERVADHFQPTPDLVKQLASVGLEEASGWEVSRLSTGERQRLALVRALQIDPEILLLDEPTSALDPPSVAKVELLLKERVAAGRTILLVTHDPEQSIRLKADCVHMEGGRVLKRDLHEEAS
ncbi:Arginine transport ATP-binding protein ArtM [Labrenzia sp. THAF82]|uniref:ABC transporter ATP-binding protein n=1 Tax=Labrenzia sp. THAF82 TaxID=2587861 RepID=UPI00126932D6|nr:ABC transporter ATP-binding protein [Labrenzia sp. THAF82]QFT31330.1 Arginine transport ATP-binding protein ArtM [Labrenzia sp. THAF82]